MAHTDFAADPSASIYEKILSCVGPATMCADVLEPVADALGAESGVYLQFVSSHYDRHGIGASRYIGGRPDAVDAYVDGLYRMDPVIQPAIDALSQLDNRSCSISSTSFEQPEFDDLYASVFLKPFDIGHVMALAVPMETDFDLQLNCLGFHRPYGESPFLPEQVAWFKRLAPALVSALQTIARCETLEISRALIGISGRQAGTVGYLVLDEDLVVRSANASGVALFGLDHPSSDNLLGNVKELLLRDPPTDGDSRALMPHDRAVPVSEIEIRGFRSGDDCQHYLVTAMGSPLRLSLDSACRAFGFTERESEVAHHIAEGKGNVSLARELGISFRTVENHLRAVYRKASVGSRTQLISRLLEFA
ncbi:MULTISPECIES: helix-turn-helix transcriptional regulator [unclassified Sphingopyxis]|uniref:helix-turn-helix transcriptional regulator n=1 Tax=unclassified Sphingopyxis TaxID=2614943 RepID=UPI002855811C|nr:MULTISPECIES: helix-turn-helix transcriptional regulator [unclassified Sphingopyxis]MDR6832437.1 DNA-binding CsgD family transcriptional regulator [Sphingopyxis sp. BE122]MDR7228180.1 DNA-binding CsgD family transcriptional regulator [Sphingopyxis sp. BE259]